MSDFPVRITADVIRGKWKLLIIDCLLQKTRRFNELRRLIPGVTHRMLSLQLQELERDDIVVRTIYDEVPPKVEYSLSRRAITAARIG